MPTSGETYFILNKKGSTALDLSGMDKKSVLGFGFHGGNNQKWKIVKHGDGWTLQNIDNGKYLDIADTPNNGVQVIAVETSNPRKWDIKPDEKESNGWRIFVQKSNQNVDVSDHGHAILGTPVTLWGLPNGENQVWRFREAS